MKTLVTFRTLCSPSIVALVLVLLCTTAVVFYPSPASAGDTSCPNVTLSGDLPAAPVGMVNVQGVTLDSNCNAVWGPIQTVPVQSQDLTPNVDVNLGTFSLVQGQVTPDIFIGGNPPTYTGGNHRLIGDQRLRDCCVNGSGSYPGGFILNEVYGDAYWTYSGQVVWSYSIGGGYSAHREYTP